LAKTLYVGNLKWEATEETLKEFFSPIGEVASIKIIMDRETGRSRGFAFVSMENSDKAIQELNGKDFMGRPLKINEAQDKPPQRDYKPRDDQGGGYKPRDDRGGYSQPRDPSPSSNEGLKTPYSDTPQKSNREWGNNKRDNRKRKDYQEY
jgi:RNA recognition motif-containing protein